MTLSSSRIQEAQCWAYDDTMRDLVRRKELGHSEETLGPSIAYFEPSVEVATGRTSFQTAAPSRRLPITPANHRDNIIQQLDTATS